jgi:hypothetical protein
MSTVTSTAQRRGFLDRLLGRTNARAEDGHPAASGEGSTSDSDDVAAEVPMRPASSVPAVRTTRHTWPTLLRRVLEVTRATAVLAVDDQGLVLGSTGEIESSEIDNIAAHVAMAFDLFERLPALGKKTESVCAQYVPDGTWLTAIRMRPPEAGRITIAIVGPYTLIREDRRRVRDAFERLFE